MYPKVNYNRMLGSKGDMSNKLIGGIKHAARYADDPLVQFGVSAIAPEVGLGLGAISAARRSGLLKKVVGK
jgi:hypothetical protein